MHHCKHINIPPSIHHRYDNTPSQYFAHETKKKLWNSTMAFSMQKHTHHTTIEKWYHRE